MVDRNLRQLLSIIVHNPTEEQCQKVIRDLRFRHSAFTPHWNYFEAKEGVYDWGWFDDKFDIVGRYTTIAPVCQLYQAPAWVDPSLKPRGEPQHPWVPWLPAEQVPKWEAFVQAWIDRYKDKFEYINLDTETNITGIWKGTPEEYATNVIIPAAKIAHRFNKKIVAPGITIQKYESDEHYTRAKLHMTKILQLAGTSIDKISVHSYAKSVKRTLEQTSSFIKDCALGSHVWVTETGFPEDFYWVTEELLESIKEYGMTGQQRQLKRFQEFITAVESTLGVERWTIYRGFDTAPDEAEKHGTNGLLDYRLKQKPAGTYVKEQLMEDRPPAKKI